MPRKKSPKISKDSVLNDDALDIDIKSDDVEVIATDIEIKNEAVSDVAVIKNAATDDSESDTEKDSKTNVYDERVAQVLGEKADKAAKTVADKAETVKDELKDKADDVKEKVADKAADIKDDLQDKVDTVKEKAETVKADIGEKLDNAKETLDDKAAELKEIVSEKTADLKETVSEKTADLKEVASEKAADLKETLDEKLSETKENLDEKLADAKEKLDEKGDELKEKAASLKDKLDEKVSQIKDLAQEKLDTAKEFVANKVDELKGKKDELKDTVSEKVAETKDELGEKVNELQGKADELKASVADKFTDKKASDDPTKETGEIVSEKAETDSETSLKQQVLDKKDEILAKGDELKDELLTKKDELKDEILAKKDELFAKKDELMSEVATIHSNAKDEAENYKKSNNTKGLAGKLGVLGAYVGGLYAQKDDYKAVDLDGEFETDAFRAQGGKIASQLFGSKGATAQNFAQKFVSDEKLSGVSAAVYQKIASWADGWALKELSGDARFDRLDSLSTDEKEAFADDIVNQNRALATLGGITGFMGLKGVVVDTAWLLLVSLKSVYQLAAIYGKPLSGKDGADIAYGILSKCDLDKLQEKQVIMTALALGNTVLVNAQSTSLADELKKVGQKYQNRSYSAAFDELSKYVNLDKLNPKWLHWLMPVGSTAISAHYNNELISEVLGVARATFRSSEVAGLIEDKSV